MNEKQDPFSAMMASRFLPERKGPTLQGLLLAALVVALVVPGLYLALEPGSAVEGRPAVQNELPEVSLGDVTLDPSDSTDSTARIGVTVLVEGEISNPTNLKSEYLKNRECDTGPCIKGGIIVEDSYNDGWEGVFADELIAFVIRHDDDPLEESVSYNVCNDGIDNTNINTKREVTIVINSSFFYAPDNEDYGYYIKGFGNPDDTDDHYWEHTITIGNEDEGGKRCPDAPVDDSPSIVLSKTSLTVPEGGSKDYTVKLNTQPTESVTVNIERKTGSSDVTLSRNNQPVTDLMFTTENWGDPQSITVTDRGDSDCSNDSATISHSAAGGGYGSVSADLRVTVADAQSCPPIIDEDDEEEEEEEKLITTPTPTVTVSKKVLEIAEGSSDTYTIKLNITPSEDVKIKITASGDLTVTGPGDDDVAATEITLTFNNTTAQTVTVTAGQDDDTADDTTVITHALSTTDTGYKGIKVPSIRVTITDDDKGVTVSKNSLNIPEGGSDSYTIKLDEKPSDPVTIDITAGDDLTVPGTSLTFTEDNWNSAQTVTVTAEHDDDTANDTTAITHTLSSDDSEYAAISVAGISVTIVDDDKGITVSPKSLAIPEGSTDSYMIQLDKTPSDPVTIDITAGGAVTVLPPSLTFSDTSAQTVNVSAAQDDDKDDDSAIISHTASSSDSGYNGISVDSVSVSIVDDDKGVTVSKESLTINEGGTDSFTVKLDKTPTADVTIIISVGGDGGSDLTVSPDSLTFSDTSPQMVTVTARQDDDTDDNMAFILHTASSTDGHYHGISIDRVSVTTIDDDIGVEVSTDSLEIPEGSTDSYTVKLGKAPSDDVTITISFISSGGDVTVLPSSLTFTRDNRSEPQIVTVTAGQDDDKFDDSAIISHAASSSDSGYNGISVDSVSVSIVDGDRGVTVSKESLTINEGGTDSFTVKLDKTPTADVTIIISVGGDGGSDLMVSPDSLTFSDTSPQMVTVTARQDDDTDDNMAFILHTASSTDGHYNGISIDNIAVTIIDDDRVASVTRSSPTTDEKDEKDEKGVTVSTDSLNIHEGSTDGYTVKLDQAPSDDVTISIAAGGDVTVSPTSLTFTRGNGTSAQTITVTAGRDEDTVDDMSAISHTASSSDSDYNGISIAGIGVTIVDGDRGVTVSQDSFTIDEGSSDSYTIKLDEAPTADVIITFSVGGDGDVTVSPGSLTFSDTSLQTVTLTGGEDDNADNETATISHTATSSDGHYSGISIVNIAVTIIDNDEEAIAVVADPITPTATPTPTPTPTPSPTPLLLAAPSPTPPSLDEPGLPVIGNAIPRVRNALGRAASAGRDRWPLVILLLVVLIGAGVAFGYLILRRR